MTAVSVSNRRLQLATKLPDEIHRARLTVSGCPPTATLAKAIIENSKDSKRPETVTISAARSRLLRLSKPAITAPKRGRKTMSEYMNCPTPSKYSHLQPRWNHGCGKTRPESQGQWPLRLRQQSK